MSTRDLFSKQSAAYARGRPRYPDTLFAALAAHAPSRAHAWDCATGSGQAAHGLAEHLGRVTATDLSAEQIAQATPHPRITYRTAPAEASGLDDASADLVAVTQAAHWLDRPAFYDEARRVLRPGGVLALVGYFDVRITEAVDAVLNQLGLNVLDDYWAPEIELLRQHYATLSLPFDEIDDPALEGLTVETRWTFAELRAYLHSWSATQAFKDATGRDPVAEVDEDLAAAWGPPDTERRVAWDLFVRAGQME